MSHGTICWLDYKGFLSALSLQFFYIVLELCIFCWEDPGPGNKAILLRLRFDHSEKQRSPSIIFFFFEIKSCSVSILSHWSSEGFMGASAITLKRVYTKVIRRHTHYTYYHKQCTWKGHISHTINNRTTSKQEKNGDLLHLISTYTDSPEPLNTTHLI